jgi:hypothetical protein
MEVSQYRLVKGTGVPRRCIKEIVHFPNNGALPIP